MKGNIINTSYYQIAAREPVKIVLNETNKFLLYLHERGEEYFLHYDYWPYVPFTHRSKETEYFIDINVRKEVLQGVIHETNTTDDFQEISDYHSNIYL